MPRGKPAPRTARAPPSPEWGLPAAPGYSLYRIVAQLGTDSWGYRFSRSHPSTRLEILDRMEVGENTILVEVRMLGPGATDWEQASRQEKGVVKVESQIESPTSVLYRVTFRAPAIHVVTRQHQVLIHYPIIVQNGLSQFETFGSSAQMRAYLEELRARVGPSHVTAVRRANVPARQLGLTPIQDSIFRDAVALGYFESPRGISLTGLAARLGRSKSTVSTALVKIQKKLAESALQVDLGAYRTTS